MKTENKAKPPAAAPSVPVSPGKHPPVGLSSRGKQTKQRVFSALDVANHFGVNRNTVYGWIRCGILPTMMVNGIHYIRAEAVEALFDKSNVEE